MKRIIIAAALLLTMTLGARAQWVEQYNPGDELKGVKPALSPHYSAEVTSICSFLPSHIPKMFPHTPNFWHTIYQR